MYVHGLLEVSTPTARAREREMLPNLSFRHRSAAFYPGLGAVIASFAP
jgi:hypothetical protein